MDLGVFLVYTIITIMLATITDSDDIGDVIICVFWPALLVGIVACAIAYCI